MKRSTLMLALCALAGAAAFQAAIQPAAADELPATPGVSAPVQVPPEVRAACEADVKKLCAGVQPGGGRILQCLAQHKAEVSDACKQAVMKARQSAP